MGKIASQDNPVAPRPTVLMQEEIRHTEAEITDTLHSIEAKLAPRRLKEQAKAKLVNGTVNGAVHLGYAVKRKPVPSALLVAGVFLLLRRRSKKRKLAELRPVPAGTLVVEALPRDLKKGRVDMGTVVVEALPKELRKSPVRTMKKYLTLGRMAFAFFSVASAVLMRGQRAQQSLDRERHYGEFGEHPAHL